MPGVRVSTAVRTGPVGAGDIVAGQFFVVGRAERGPVDAPMLLRSFSDYSTYFGNYASNNLYAHVKTYFDEGGTRCYVQRVVKTGGTQEPAKASVELEDSASDPAIAFTAANVGAWANGAAGGLKVQIVAPDNAGFKVKVFLNDVLILTTRDLVDVADAVNVVNSSGVSHLIEAAVVDDLTPAVNANPVSLSGGLDGDAVDNATIAAALATDTTVISANLGTGSIAAPGFTGSVVWEALRDHAAAFNRIAICSFAANANAATAKSGAAAYYGDAKASYMAFYWPFIKVDTPSVTAFVYGSAGSTGSTITIAPDAYAAAARSRAVQEAGGPWRAGAGQISAARAIRGLESDVTPATGDALDNARVNAIRTIGSSIRVYGARSVSNDEANWRYITMRDTLNYITVGIEERMERYVFETIDGRGGLFGRIRGSIKAFLEPIRIAGGLYEAFDDTGALVDPGYSVVVDSSINPASQLATGLVKAQVGVRVSGVADLIEIVVTKSNLSAPII